MSESKWDRLKASIALALRCCELCGDERVAEALRGVMHKMHFLETESKNRVEVTTLVGVEIGQVYQVVRVEEEGRAIMQRLFNLEEAKNEQEDI